MKKEAYIFGALGIVLVVSIYVYFYPNSDGNGKSSSPTKKILQNEIETDELVTTSPTKSPNTPTIYEKEIIPTSVINLDSGSKQSNESTYTHPQLDYSFIYPNAWKAETAEKPYPSYDGYLDAIVYPSERTRITQYQTTPEIFIHVEDTTDDVQTYFSSDSLGEKYAISIQNITILDVPGIVYEWSVESSVKHTTVLFVKNDKAYKIEFSWSSENEKNKHFETFTRLYQSLSI